VGWRYPPPQAREARKVHPDTYLALELRRWLQGALSCQHSLCHLNFISTFSVETPGLGMTTPFGTRSCKFWIVIGSCLATALFFSHQQMGQPLRRQPFFWENKNSLLLPASPQLGRSQSTAVSRCYTAAEEGLMSIPASRLPFRGSTFPARPRPH
jgi:hypothetical protein